MRRRSFLGRLALTATAVATGCAAPPAPRRMLRLGGLSAETPPADGSRPLVELDIMEGLRAVGLVAGENMTIEWRHTRGRSELFAGLARELVSLPVDIVIASSSRAAVAAKTATRTIPIVMQGVADPLDFDLIESYAHPGGNITGAVFSNHAEAIKRIELLHEAFPTLSRGVLIGNPNDTPARLAELLGAARSLGIELSAPVLQTEDDLTRTLNAIDDACGLVIRHGTFADMPRVVSFATERRIRGVFSRASDARAGGFMSYGSDRREIRLAAGSFVRRIADGAVPGDLPVQLPGKFDLVVNLVTAQRGGWAIPESVLAMATEVVR